MYENMQQAQGGPDMGAAGAQGAPDMGAAEAADDVVDGDYREV